MKKINLSDLSERERHSPAGKFHSFSKEISVALGREEKSLDLNKRHPFDLTLARIPPGAAYCPYHAEGAQWELYLVVSGRGKVRDASGETEAKSGDSFLFKPGEAHQLSCVGEEDFVYYVVADNPIGDSCFYPDSGKWAVRKEGDENVIVRGSETDYFDGEE
ncbi:MAG: cupin domain-containing protein [Chthoniobacterales bacterium]